MLSSGFRRAFSRFGSSSERLDQPTDETSRKDKSKIHAAPERYVSEEGVIYSSTLSSNPWRDLIVPSKDEETPAVKPHPEKQLPWTPSQSNGITSQTGLFEAIPHLTTTVADSVKANLEPVVLADDKAASEGLLLDKLITQRDVSTKDDTRPTPASLGDDIPHNPKRTFLDRRLVALSIADNISSDSDDNLSTLEPEPADTMVEQKRGPNPVQPPLHTAEANAQRPKLSVGQVTSAQEESNSPHSKRSKSSFSSFLTKLATVPSTNSIPSHPSSAQDHATLSLPLLTDSNPHDLGTSDFKHSDDIATSHSASPNSLPTSVSPSDDDVEEKKKKRKRPQNTFLMLQPIVESGDNLSSQLPKPSSGFTPSTLGVDSTFAKKMEETGRLRRLQSQQNITSAQPVLKPLILSPTALQSPPTPAKPASNANTHTKARSEGDVLTSRQVPDSSGPHSKAVEDKVAQLTTSDDQDALHDFLERTLRELEEAQRESARIRAQSILDKTRLEEELKAANDELLTLRRETRQQKAEIADYEKQLKGKDKDVLRLSSEKQHWQEQLDTMHHRLNQAERQIRCLDHLTHSKLGARTEGVYGPTRRAKLATVTKDPSLEVMGAVAALNEEILQSANLMVENLERTKSFYPTSGDLTLSRSSIGNKLTSMLKSQASDDTKGFRFLLMQVVLEVFMVHWCTSIIEGWYPKQQSFADLLIEMHSKTVTSSAARVDCGKIKLIETNTVANVTVKYGEWAADVLRDLSQVLSVAGLRMRLNRTSMFTSKLLSLVKMAYDVRTALAEKDICGNLELSVVGPDLPFQPRWMEEAHAMSRQQHGATLQTEPIVGTCGMGLKRAEVKKKGNDAQDYSVVLKPKVVLARVLEESP